MKIPTKKYIKDAVIYLSGQANPKEFYIIKSGEIKISRTNPILGLKEEIRTVGYIFGIIQCITGVIEDETAQAVTDCEIFIIKKNLIEKVFTTHKNVFLKILSEYSEILRKLDADLISFNFFPEVINIKEKVFDIAQKYIDAGEKKKASHILSTIKLEYRDDENFQEKVDSLLIDLPSVSLIEKTGIITEKIIPAKTVIFTEFEFSNDFYIIKRGKVSITKLKNDKEILLAILGEGDIFGEMSVLNDKPRNATASTIEETELMIIDKKGIDKLPPPLFIKSLEFISKRIWLVQQQLICYKLPLVVSKLYFILYSKIKQTILNFDEELKGSFIFKFPLRELYQMIDYDYEKYGKSEVMDFLNDKNIEFFSDSIKIRNLKEFIDKNSYYFSRACISYNSAIENM